MSRILGFVRELSLLLLGSMLAGFVIGTLQHFVAFGVWGYGFDPPAIQFAFFDGGLLGIVFSIPTGVISYYMILKRHVNLKQVAIIVGGSLVGGCCAGVAVFWPSAFVTPVVTMLLAGSVRGYNESRKMK